jgi:hypothetical protein
VFCFNVQYFQPRVDLRRNPDPVAGYSPITVFSKGRYI